MTIAANFTPKSAILSFVITHELLTMRLFLDSLANINFRMKTIYVSLLTSFLLLLTVISCSQKENMAMESNIIDCTLANAKQITKLSQICDSISLITLESKPDNIIGDIKKLFEYKNRFYILSNNSIFIFKNDGSYIGNIKRIGHASNEYVEIDDFCLFDNNIFISDAQNKKIIVLSENGTYVKNIILDVYPEKIIALSDSTIAIKCSGTENQLCIYNINKNIITKEYFPYEIKYNYPQSQVFVSIGKEVGFKLPFSNELQILSGDGDINKSLKFDFGKDNINEHDLSEKNFDGYPMIIDSKGNANILSTCQYKNYICIKFECPKISKRGYYYLLINQQKHEIFLLDPKNFIDDVTFYSERLLPDFEQSGKNGFLGIIYPIFWKDNFKNIPKSLINGQYSKLKNTVSEINELQNPIICIYHF